MTTVLPQAPDSLLHRMQALTNGSYNWAVQALFFDTADSSGANPGAKRSARYAGPRGARAAGVARPWFGGMAAPLLVGSEGQGGALS
jgi:hypothetical protein